jgi:hypothetical protein
MLLAVGGKEEFMGIRQRNKSLRVGETPLIKDVGYVDVAYSDLNKIYGLINN